jgi:hypothetical protein
MLADDLGSAVALDPLGAGVPGADHAIAIQEIDRVVGDRIDQELEPIGGRQVLYGTGKLEFHFVHITPRVVMGGCFIVGALLAIVNRPVPTSFSQHFRRLTVPTLCDLPCHEPVISDASIRQ